ncbi:MAG: T9SS type A sorting domain-containing protein [Chitinophagaceae bacterium]|nr:T9SS type A sorting domain-containing protein [Chitinophagaceae bacterium]
MQKIVTLLCCIASILSLYGQTDFTPGNLVVVRVGSTDSALSNRSREVFLDEYTPTGTLVQSVSIPYSGANKLTISGFSSLEGNLSLSQNKAYLIMGGYDLELGVSSPSSNTANAQRVLARINKKGIADLTTKLPNADLHTGNSLRSVASFDGTGFWTAAGNQGVRYAAYGSTASVLVSNTITNGRTVKVIDGQLYLSHSQGSTFPRLMTVGSGLPVNEGNVATALPGLSATGAYVDFHFFDRDATEPGNDVVYIADDGSGVRKFSKVGGSWVENGILGVSSDTYRGLTGTLEKDTIVLYATRKGGTNASGGGELVRIVDSANYNSVIRASATVLVSAAANTAFRGIAFAPTEEVLPLQFTRFTGQVNNQLHLLDWKTEQAYNVDHFTVQLSTDMLQFADIGRVNARQGAVESYQFSYQSKLAGKHLYRLQVTDLDGKTYYSPLVALFAQKEADKLEIFPNPTQNGVITILHPAAGKNAGISIIHSDGRVLLNQPVQAGSTQSSVNTGNLSKGIYRVVFMDEKVRQQKAVLKD